MRMRSVALLATAVVLVGACSNGSDKPEAVSSTAPLSPATTSTTIAPTSPSRTTPGTTVPRSPSAADLAAVRVRLQPVVSGFTSPVDVIFRPGTNQMFVVEQGGTLVAVTNGRAAATAALDLSGNLSSGNEQGF